MIQSLKRLEMLIVCIENFLCNGTFEWAHYGKGTKVGYAMQSACAYNWTATAVHSTKSQCSLKLRQ